MSEFSQPSSFPLYFFSTMVENYTMRERMSGAINALSISPEGNSVVVAGRESNISKHLCVGYLLKAL